MGARSDGVDSATGTVASPILGGTAATKGQAATAVALLDARSGQVFCSGALIAQTVIATAAHCVAIENLTTGSIHYRERGEIIVVAGALDATNARPEERSSLSGVVCHPGYPGPSSSGDPEGLGTDNDLCLLLLEAPITTVPLVEVPPRRLLETLVHEGTPVTIAGYGLHDLDGALPGVLYVAETPFKRASHAEFLAGESGAPDTCRGDSGGAAYVSEAGKTYLLGTAARRKASATALCGEGGIYTLLPSYTSWMRDASEGAYEPLADPGAPEAGGACGVGREPRARCSGLLVGLGVILLLARRRRAL
jgi:secreted trypsin-like serine protease